MKKVGRKKPTYECKGKKYWLNNRKLNSLVREWIEDDTKPCKQLDHITNGINELAKKKLITTDNLKSWIRVEQMITPTYISEIIEPMAEYFGVEVMDLLIEADEERKQENSKMTGINNINKSEKDTLIDSFNKMANILAKINSSDYYSYVPEYPDFYDADEWYASEVDRIISEIYKSALLLSRENYEKLLIISYEVEGLVKGGIICEQWERINENIRKIYFSGYESYKLDSYAERREALHDRGFKFDSMEYSELIGYYKEKMGVNLEQYSDLVEVRELVARELVNILSVRFRECFEELF